MFVKFVHYPKDKSSTMVEDIVECKGCTISYFDDGKMATFHIRSPFEHIEVPCEFTVVYIMSDTGKTIDSYKWKNVDGVIKRM